MSDKVSKFEDEWQAISFGHSWKGKSYFVERIYSQKGDTCAAYLLEFYQSREIKEPTAINIDAFVKEFSINSKEDNVVNVMNEVKRWNLSMNEFNIKTDISEFEWDNLIAPPLTNAATIDEMIGYLQRGPFIAVVKASQEFRSYKSSFDLDSLRSYYSPGQADDETDDLHALLVIGYRKFRASLLFNQIYFLVKNSWSAAWGRDGYAWIKISDANPMQFGAQIHRVIWN